MNPPMIAAEFCQRGAERHRPGDLAGALQDFDEAVRLDDGNPEAHYNRGVARQALDDLDGALSAYETAVQLRADYAEAVNNLGIIQFTRGNMEAAGRVSTRCCAWRPGTSRPKTTEAWCARRWGTWRGPLPTLTKSCARSRVKSKPWATGRQRGAWLATCSARWPISTTRCAQRRRTWPPATGTSAA